MFVKKLMEKASKKQLGDGGINGLRATDVNPRLVFHHGIPSGSHTMAYDPSQHILAISTKDGRIKLLGSDNTQALLQSEAVVPSKFLQFLENQGILLNLTIQNYLEVWDIDKKELCYTHVFKEEISSFAAVPQSPYMYVADCLGNITVLKFDWETLHLVQMQYTIPFAEAHGITEVSESTEIARILPQPMAESKRVLIVYNDGILSLWDIKESKVVYTAGGNLQHSLHHEPKTIASACWACLLGSKVAVGYSNGEIFLWALPELNRKELPASSSIPLFKLNLGYKTDKVPIVSLRWVAGDGRTSRLYVNGFSDIGSSHSFQVVILDENSESRTIKLVLPLSEACRSMEIISCFGDRNKHKESTLVLLLKSGRLCLYDDSEVEQYLLQCQTKSPPPLPSQLVVKLPFSDSSITVAKLYAGGSASSSHMDEGHILANKYSSLLSIDAKEGNHTSSTCFTGFTKTGHLYITGHYDGSINFWDASCPLFVPILSIEQQIEKNNPSSGVSVTALHFDVSSQILLSGDRNGLVRIITFKKVQSASENLFSFLQAKKGGNYIVQIVRFKGAILSISINPGSRHLAIGTDKGFVFLVDLETTSVLYQKQFPSQLYAGVVSLQFENCVQNGYEKNALLVGMEDSSVLAIEEDTGNTLSSNIVHTKKPSRALLMQVLGASRDGVCISDSQDISSESTFKENLPKQSLLLLCSENAVRLYSLSHVVQGIKKTYSKKKLNGTCCCASVLYGPSSDVGIILVFAGGKIEIRSLPDLTLLKDASLRGFMYPTLRPHANSSGAVCVSSEGELVAVNGDTEMVFFSVLFRKDVYSYLEFIKQVYKKNVVAPKEGRSSGTNAHTEKKKGLFGMVLNDFKGNKSKHSQETDFEDSGARTAEELSAIFSTANFSVYDESRSNSVKYEADMELDIDDIDLEDAKEKPKGQKFSILNKQKLGQKLQSIKGKLKPKTDEKANLGKAKSEDDKAIGALDQIKKKYGYSVSSESSAAKMAESKLSENVRKLQNIGTRTTDMEDTAQSFSSMAKELLRTVQRQEKNS